MTFLGTTSTYYGSKPVQNPPNVLTNIRGKPPAKFQAPIGTISIDWTIREAWMLIAAPDGIGDWQPIIGPGGLDSLTGDNAVRVFSLNKNINLAGGANVTIIGDALTHTLTISASSGGGVVWETVNAASVQMFPNVGYISIFPGAVIYTLPSVADVGDIIEIGGFTSSSWRVSQNAGQRIIFGEYSTTLGTAGYLTSARTTDTLKMVCIAANATFQVLSSIGNITVF